MPRLSRLCLPLLLAALLAGGCSVFGRDPIAGYLVTWTQVPFTIDLDNTPVATTTGSSAVVRIREPVTGYGIYTELNSNAIGDIARRHGLATLYFADLKTFSLLGVWRSQTLTLYGEPARED